MTDPDPTTSTVNTSAAAATPTITGGVPALAGAALILALLALILFAWQWYDSRTAVESIRLEVAKKIAEAEGLNKASRTVADQAREASTEAQTKLAVLESRVAESQSQQIALEALYQELSRNSDEAAFAEIEQSLLIASQQLQLAGNVKAALIALQNADARMQRLERPQLTPLRKVLNRDIERLKALPFVDTVGFSVRLDNVISSIPTLPLAMEVRPPTPETEAAGTAPANAWQRLVREAWTDLKQLVRVQNMGREEVPLLAPSQIFFLRENLKLRLLGARLALLARDQASYKADLEAASVWLTRYYDTREKSVASALSTLRNLQAGEINIELPDISATVDAVRNLRLARERPVR
ncbi:MAG: uroporphyrinogen-III C-methyltransferase [Pseudomonadota bacterium]